MSSWHCARCGPLDEATAATYRSTACPTCGGPLALERPSDHPLRFDCPGCHAEVPASAARCPSCQRWLGTPRCDGCHAPLVAPYDGPCHECGRRVAPATYTVARGVPCPVCDAELIERMLAGEVVLDCATCAGVFVADEPLRRWTADRAAQAPALDPGPRHPELTVRYRRCPACAQVMNRVNFGPGSGVIVDVCSKHGVWFDPGELGTVLAYARSGRLEIAQRNDRARRAAERREVDRQVSAGLVAMAAAEGHHGAADLPSLLLMFARLVRRIFH